MNQLKENEQTLTRKRIVGLKDLAIALVTTNDSNNYAADVPVRLARAVTATVKENFSKEDIYSDDAVEDTVDSFEKVEIEVEVNRLAPGDQALLFDCLYNKGYLLKSGDDKAKEIAVGFRAKQANGKYEFNWYYCGTASRPEKSYETIKDKKTPQSEKITFTMYQRNKEDIVNGEKKRLYAITVDESQLLEDYTA